MATSTTVPRLMTIEEYDALPEDGLKHELLWGELVSVAPNVQHMKLVDRIDRAPGGYVDAHGLGVVGSEGTFQFMTDLPLVLVPDVAFVRSENVPPHDQQVKGNIRVVPDLAIEVVSPSETSRTIHAKANAYLDQGVQLVVIYPEREEVIIWSPDRTTRVLGAVDELSFGEIVPGFRLPIGTLFED